MTKAVADKASEAALDEARDRMQRHREAQLDGDQTEVDGPGSGSDEHPV